MEVHKVKIVIFLELLYKCSYRKIILMQNCYMKNLKYYIVYMLLVVTAIFYNTAYCNIEGNVKPYLLRNKPGLDIVLKGIYNDKIKGVITIIPLEICPGVTTWNFIPEYYISTKNDALGRITIGSHNADILMVDGGTFAVNNSNLYNDGTNLYSQSLTNNIQTNGYKYKISYLIKRDNIYLSSAYSPLDNRKQIRVLYGDSLSTSTDFKGSISIVNNTIFTGFNLKYLGFIIGGSYGGNFYTAGLGYSIGPFKSSLTYLSEGNNIMCGVQYNFNKNIMPFIQLGYSRQDRGNILLGFKLTT